MAESYHEKLNRVRKPRVHIKYEVELGDAQLEVELPFVVGVMGDFSGNPTKELPALRDRRFVQIDRDNFDEVLARMTPGLNLRVENTLKGDKSEMGVQLKFEKMEDFEPANIVDQVEPLKKLLETRNKLRDLQTAADLDPKLEAKLEEILKETEGVQKAADDLGVKPDAEGDE